MKESNEDGNFILQFKKIHPWARDRDEAERASTLLLQPLKASATRGCALYSTSASTNALLKIPASSRARERARGWLASDHEDAILGFPSFFFGTSRGVKF